VHGVSSKKIKHMLDTYEHNITGQSLFAMLPPLDCRKLQTLTTSVGTSVDSAQKQSEMPAVDDLCHFLSSSGAGIDVTSAHSCIVSSSESTLPASGPHTVASSGHVLSAEDGVHSCSLSDSGTLNLVSETVVSHPTDIPATASCKTVSLPSHVFENALKSICRDSVGTDGSTAGAVVNACSADVWLPVCTASLSNNPGLMLLAEHSALSSKVTFSSGTATVTSPPSAHAMVTTNILCTDKNCRGNSAAANGETCAYVVQTSGKLLASEVSEVISSRSPDDEAVDVVTEHDQSANETTSSARSIDTASRSFAELKSGSPSRTVPADVHLGCNHPQAVDADTQNMTNIPRCAADTQPSDKADALLMSSVPEVANCYLMTGSGTAESDDAHLSDAFCDAKSACGQVESVDGDLPTSKDSDVEHLKQVTLDKTMRCVSSHAASEKNDKKYSKLTHHLDADEIVGESETYCTVHDVDKDGTTKLLCENEKAPAAIEEKLRHDVGSSDEIQSVVQSPESDRPMESKPMVENTEIHNAQRVAELMYWGQIDTGERLNNADSKVEVHSAVLDTVTCGPPMADSPAESCIPGIEPKPRRMSLRSCQKKPASSLMERIVAGKEWLSECESCPNTIAQSERSVVDVAPSHSDQCRAKQHSVSDDCRSDSTQTEPHDFAALAKATNGEEVLDMPDYIAVVETSPRSISSHVTDSRTSPNAPVRLMLHKSCSTADESENVDNSSQLDLLASCFPSISSHDLQELLTNCGNDIVVVADLLLEFGYEYNEPREDIAHTMAPSSSSSCSSSSRASPDRSVAVKNSSPSVKETKSSKKNSSALCRLYRDSLISKGVVAESVKIQPPFEFQVPINVPTSGLCLCVLFHLLLKVFCTLSYFAACC